jgi:phage terminase large subunit
MSETTLKVQTTKVFSRLRNADRKGYTYIANEGGSRSSKTYSTLQYLIFEKSYEVPAGTMISIVRRHLATNKATVMRDFIAILQGAGWYDPGGWNNTNPGSPLYTVNNLTFEFIGMDYASKKQGASRELLFANEVLELSLEEFMQLDMRTKHTVYADYNPKYTKHWFYDTVLTDTGATLLHSTYADNPFLPEQQKRKIEALGEKDDFYYQVYALGQRGEAGEIVFPRYELINEMNHERHELVGYGIDFGETSPTAVVYGGMFEDVIEARELIYQSHLRDNELIDLLRKKGVGDDPIICDTNRPDKIATLAEAGFNVAPASKQVVAGIAAIKNYDLRITKDSENLLDERSSYSWKVTREGFVLDEPVKVNDHAIDALRYWAFMAHNAKF